MKLLSMIALRKPVRPLFLLVPLLFISCSETQPWNVADAVNAIFAPDELQFRKFEVGMPRTDFDAAYTGDAIYGNDLEVIDSVSVSDGIYCETAFRFDKENMLREISVQLVIEDESQKNELFDAIRQKLSSDFGEGIKDRDQYYWRAEGGITTTDIYLTDYSSVPKASAQKKFVIVLYYTAGTVVS